MNTPAVQDCMLRQCQKEREEVSSFTPGQTSRSSLDEAIFGHVLWSLEPVAYETPCVDWLSVHWVSIFGQRDGIID